MTTCVWVVCRFFTVYTLWIVAYLLASFTLRTVGMESKFILLIFELTFPTFIYSYLYIRFTLTPRVSLLKELKFRMLAYSVVFLVLILYSIITVIGIMFDRTGIENIVISFSILEIFISLLLALIFLIVYLVVCLINKKRIIEDEKIELKELLDDLISKHHKYRHMVPTLLISHQRLIGKIQHINETDQATQLKEVKNYAEVIKRLSSKLNVEFATDDIKLEVDFLEIPDEWLDLTMLIECLIREAHDKGIYLAINNQALD